MVSRRERELSPREVRQRVRRYPRDKLLRGIGRLTASAARSRHDGSAPDNGWIAAIQEGYLLLLAGVCVTRCNNDRSPPVTENAIGELVNDLYALRDPGIDGPEQGAALQRELSRMMYVQMPFQNEPWPPLMRTLCLYGDDPRFGEPALGDTRWQDIVGVPMDQFLRIGFLMYVAAIQNDGAIDRAVFDPERFDPIVAPLNIAEALAVADEWLTKPVAELAAAGRAHSPNEDDFWGYNPFFEYPIALLRDGNYVMPSPLAVLQRLSPQGAFFIVRDAIENGQIDGTVRSFSDALGTRFERYIGEQLRQMQHITLHPEITYNRGQNRSVDYIIETPQVLVLVEAKSTAPDAATRGGIDLDTGTMGQTLDRACKQITRSAQEIQQGNPLFPQQDGRPMRGLVVTREPFYNLPFAFIGNTMPSASVPTSVWSSQILEHAIASLTDEVDCGTQLLGVLADNTDTLDTSIGSLPPLPNPLLGDLWEQWHLTWPQPDEAAEGDYSDS